MRRILIVGGGFAGVSAANAIAAGLSPRRRIQVQLVSDSAHFTFTPLLPAVASGSLDPVSIQVPLHDALGDQVEFEMDRIEAIDLSQKVAHGAFEHPWDYLIVAPGSVPNFPSDAWESSVQSFGSATDAIAIRETLIHLTQTPEHSDAPLRIVVIGGGPTGVALAAELQSFLFDELIQDSRAREAAEVLIVEQEGSLLPSLPTQMRELTERHFKAKNIQLLKGRAHSPFAGGIHVDNTRIEAQLVIWCGGVKPSPLLEQIQLPRADDGRLVVDENMRAHFGIYAVGDAAHSDCPWSAQVAIQQAQVAAHNALSDAYGRSHRTFSYSYTGDILTLGRSNAAVFYQGFAFEGKAAQTLFRVIYAAQIPTSVQKLRVLRDWMGARRGTRALT